MGTHKTNHPDVRHILFLLPSLVSQRTGEFWWRRHDDAAAASRDIEARKKEEYTTKNRMEDRWRIIKMDIYTLKQSCEYERISDDGMTLAPARLWI